ncbi:tetratricopeptide repeat protein [Candidatus Uhrbacteria bacterium]|nr:tetratricopeptide repeat protein [Candidatus Uhrbacteria bacterium]
MSVEPKSAAGSKPPIYLKKPTRRPVSTTKKPTLRKAELTLADLRPSLPKTSTPIPERVPTPALTPRLNTWESAWEPAPPATLTPETARKKSGGVWILALAIFLFPFVVWPWKGNTQEFSKQLYLTLLVACGLSVSLFYAFKEKAALPIPRHPFVILGSLTLAVATISALTSGLLPFSLFGYGGVETLSLFSLLLLGLWILYTYKAGKNYSALILNTLIASGSLLSLIILLSLFGLNLYSFALASGFNPSGTTTLAAIIASVTIILGSGELIASSGRARLLYSVAILPPLILILGVALRPVFITAAAGFGLLLALTMLRKNATGNFIKISLGIALILSVLLALFPLPNFLDMPAEISPTRRETWTIARQTLQENPLLGVGPAAFGTAYLRFRSLPILQTPFWNVTFDWGSSSALTMLTNLGWLGGGLLFITILSIFLSGLIAYLKKPEARLLTALAGGLALFVSFFLTPLSFTGHFFFSTLLGLLLALTATAWQRNSTSEKPFPLVKILQGALFLVALLALLITQVQRTHAQVLLERVLNTENLDRVQAENLLIKAADLDPYFDAAPRLLAQLRRAKLQELISTLNQENGQLETQLLQIREQAEKALSAAQEAVRRAPKNTANLITLGSAYLDLSPVAAGASTAATEAFERAKELSPNDPAILVNLALARAAVATRAEETAKPTLLQDAQELLKTATEIRPNFPFAHLELARLLAQQGATDEAKQVYAQVRTLVQGDPSLNYEVGLFLLQSGHADEAQTTLEEALRLAPKFSNARWFLAQIYEQKNDLSQAVEQLEHILGLNPENEAAKTRLEELKQKLAPVE